MMSAVRRPPRHFSASPTTLGRIARQHFHFRQETFAAAAFAALVRRRRAATGRTPQVR